MWHIKWLSAFLCIVNIRCSMIVGNYKRPIFCPASNTDGLRCQSCKFMCGFLFFTLTVPQTKSPHDLSNSFWHELSSPPTESSDENFGESTTHVHEPFFEENSTQINVTTQLGSDVYLHCRVNDLREKMVSKVRKCLHLAGKMFARN